MIDLTSLPTPDLAALVSRASEELARRAGGVSAAAQPVQLALIPDLDPVDPASVDLEERLADGSRRWVSPKEVAGLLRCSEDSVVRRINRDGIGIRFGGRYRVDVTRIRGRV